MKILFCRIAVLPIIGIFLFLASGVVQLLAEDDDALNELSRSKPIVYSSGNTRTTSYTLDAPTKTDLLEVYISLNPKYINESNISLYRRMWQGMANVHLIDRINGQDFENHQDALFYIKWDDFQASGDGSYRYRIFQSIAPNRLNISLDNTTLVYSGTDSYFYIPSSVLLNSGGNFFWIEIITPAGELHSQSGFIQI